MLLNNKIRCFLSLAETKSFTTTAGLLFLTQQAVSKNIARMEEELGMQLFIRNSRNVELTPAGAQCFRLLSRLVNEYNIGISAILQDFQNTQRQLRIGMQDFLNFGISVQAAAKKLEEVYPGFQMETIRYSPLVLQERLRDKQLDLILIYRRFIQDSAGLQSLELAGSSRFLMVSPFNPLVREGAAWQDFKKLPLITDSVQGEHRDAYHKRVQDEVHSLGLKPAELIWAPDRDSAYTAAEAGRGIVVGTEMSRMAQARNLISYPFHTSEMLLAVWEKKNKNPLVEEFARQIKAGYEEQGGRFS